MRHSSYPVTFIVFVGCVPGIFSIIPEIPTRGGTAFGLPCHFPFRFNGSLHYTCLPAATVQDLQWCSVVPYYTGRYPHNFFGFCDISYQLSDFKVFGGNGANTSCVFPFIYKNRYHHHCIAGPQSPSWCATMRNYDTDALWGFCEPESAKSQGITLASGKVPITWTAANDYCLVRSKRLCSEKEICSTKMNESNLNRWIPVEDAKYDWVKMTNITDVCSKQNKPIFEKSFTSQFKAILCCNHSYEDFPRYVRLANSCMIDRHLAVVQSGLTAEECFEKCKEMRCASFTYGSQEQVCFTSEFNSNTAREEFEKCSYSYAKQFAYYERVKEPNLNGTCRFPFLWKGKLRHECVRMNGQQYCSTTDGVKEDLNWVFCKDCYSNDRLSEYRGRKSKTKTGKACVNWKLSAFDWRSGEDGLGDHNFCRNPDFDPSGPWCYVTGGESYYEYCDVKQCSQTAQTHSCEALKGSAIIKIYGGEFVLHPGDIPWQVSFYHTRTKTSDCGGTLVGSCHVVTAAHCFKKSSARQYIVRNGLQATDPMHQALEIEQVYIHPLYNVRRRDNDIAVVQLKSTHGDCFQMSPSVQPVCLPNSGHQFPSGWRCMVSGWGQTENEKSARNLKFLILPLISHDVCSSRELYGSKITDNMLCAGYLDSKADSCSGDSGGPLACRDRSTDAWVLWGVVSWGETCGERGKPGVYTKVARYLDWIRSVIDSRQT